MNSCCAEAGKFMRACGLRRELKKLVSCWTAMRWIASLAKSVPSLAICCLVEFNHQNAPPINTSTMITRTRTCPDDFRLELNFSFFIFVLITEPHALYHLAITDKHGMFL